MFELKNEVESIEKGYEEINRYQAANNEKELKFLKVQQTMLNNFMARANEVVSDPQGVKRAFEKINPNG